MSWTEEKVAKLKELWSKGHTASQIAEALGDKTRNSSYWESSSIKFRS